MPEQSRQSQMDSGTAKVVIINFAASTMTPRCLLRSVPWKKNMGSWEPLRPHPGEPSAGAQPSLSRGPRRLFLPAWPGPFPLSACWN